MHVLSILCAKQLSWHLENFVVVNKTVCTLLKVIVKLVCVCDVCGGGGRGALRRIMHNQVCIELHIANFPPMTHGFIMQENL